MMLVPLSQAPPWSIVSDVPAPLSLVPTRSPVLCALGCSLFPPFIALISEVGTSLVYSAVSSLK